VILQKRLNKPFYIKIPKNYQLNKMKKHAVFFLCGLVLFDILLIISYIGVFNFMTIDGLILNSSLFGVSISPVFAVTFWIFCLKTKNKKIILLSIFPGILAVFSLILLIKQLLMSGIFD
jgi:hypothetical protein